MPYSGTSMVHTNHCPNSERNNWFVLYHNNGVIFNIRTLCLKEECNCYFCACESHKGTYREEITMLYYLVNWDTFGCLQCIDVFLCTWLQELNANIFCCKLLFLWPWTICYAYSTMRIISGAVHALCRGATLWQHTHCTRSVQNPWDNAAVHTLWRGPVTVPPAAHRSYRHVSASWTTVVPSSCVWSRRRGLLVTRGRWYNSGRQQSGIRGWLSSQYDRTYVRLYWSSNLASLWKQPGTAMKMFLHKKKY